MRSRYLANLNKANWPYFIMNSDGSFVEYLDTIDCVRIHLQQVKIAEDPQNSKSMLFLPLSKMKVSIATMEAKHP